MGKSKLERWRGDIVHRLSRIYEYERDTVDPCFASEVVFIDNGEESYTISSFQQVTLPLTESTNTSPSTETLSVEDEFLSEEEMEDLERSMAEIERGEAKTFNKVDDALRWLKE
ncbi:MAG: hypothetical protein QXY01_05575 [Candidatus Bathyarchaeia archaeon]